MLSTELFLKTCAASRHTDLKGEQVGSARHGRSKLRGCLPRRCQQSFAWLEQVDRHRHATGTATASPAPQPRQQVSPVTTPDVQEPPLPIFRPGSLERVGHLYVQWHVPAHRW